MPPKIGLSNEMIAYTIEIIKKLRENKMNLKVNLPKIFNLQFGINLSYTKLSKLTDFNCFVSDEIKFRVSELSVLQILLNYIYINFIFCI